VSDLLTTEEIEHIREALLNNHVYVSSDRYSPRLETEDDSLNLSDEQAAAFRKLLGD
jgi:hypothetical protein